MATNQGVVEFINGVHTSTTGDTFQLLAPLPASHRFELENLAFHQDPSRVVAENVAAAVEVESEEEYLCSMDIRLLVWKKVAVSDD